MRMMELIFLASLWKRLERNFCSSFFSKSLDASLLVAYYNADDVNHTDARKLIRDMEGRKVSFLISDYVFDEILTVLLVRAGKEKAIEVCNKLLKDIETGNIRLMHVDEEAFRKAIEVFIQFADKKWSLTDCTSYILMKSTGVTKCASFDEHFRQFGFEVLPRKPLEKAWQAFFQKACGEDELIGS